MKKLTTLFGTSLFAASGIIAPLTATAMPRTFESNSRSTYPSRIQPSQKMAIYSDCLHAHTDISGADFKQVSKFCSCVADQSIQGDLTLSNCSTGSGAGRTFGMIGEVAPSVISGVVEGIASRSGKSDGTLSKGSDLLNGLSGLLGGGLLGGGSIQDLIKGR
jgi:hypothetical protein